MTLGDVEIAYFQSAIEVPLLRRIEDDRLYNCTPVYPPPARPTMILGRLLRLFRLLSTRSYLQFLIITVMSFC